MSSFKAQACGCIIVHECMDKLLLQFSVRFFFWFVLPLVDEVQDLNFLLMIKANNPKTTELCLTTISCSLGDSFFLWRNIA